MEQSKNEILNKANGLAQDFKNKMNSGEKSMEKLSLEAGEKVGAMASDFANTTADYMKTSREYVQKNPSTGVAIAAAAGLVVGSLLTIALRKKQ